MMPIGAILCEYGTFWVQKMAFFSNFQKSPWVFPNGSIPLLNHSEPPKTSQKSKFGSKNPHLDRDMTNLVIWAPGGPRAGRSPGGPVFGQNCNYVGSFYASPLLSPSAGSAPPRLKSTPWHPCGRAQCPSLFVAECSHCTTPLHTILLVSPSAGSAPPPTPRLQSTGGPRYSRGYPS